MPMNGQITWQDIQKLENIAMLNFYLADFNARIAGMIAENKQREHLGQSMAYTEEDFEKARCEMLGDPMSTLRMGL
jgi:hypothetical protein